jgi:YgiT-type zinc finger domain-containing protein
MSTNYRNETSIEPEVTYPLEANGKFLVIENVPAKVCIETGERFFAP